MIIDMKKFTSLGLRPSVLTALKKARAYPKESLGDVIKRLLKQNI